MDHHHASAATDRTVLYLTVGIFSLAILFALFFQVSKGSPFGPVNPFGEDPYDAIGSFAFQAALLFGLLTFGRALRLQRDPAQFLKGRLILRGDALVLLVILFPLAGDAMAELSNPNPVSSWGTILLVELVIMIGLTLGAVIALGVIFIRLPTPEPPEDLTLADALDDLWALVRIPVSRSSGVLPFRLAQWAARFNSDRAFVRLPWIDPRRHTWRFVILTGLLLGFLLALAQLGEGLPPNLRTGLLVMGIFIVGETAAVLLGFALLGGYLGLRPPLVHLNATQPNK